MRQSRINREMLRSYICGSLREPDRLALAERTLIDDELFDELLVVESDLFDQYVRGQLTPDERSGFESYLHRLPDPQHRIGVATALMKASSEARLTFDDLPASPSWWRGMLSPPRIAQAAPRYLAAAASLLLAIAVIWLIIYSRHLSNENDRLQASVAKLATEREAIEQQRKSLEENNAGQQAKIEQLERELEEAQQDRELPLRTLTSPVVSLELTDASRDASAPDRVHLTKGVTVVLLRAPVGFQKRYTGYRAVIQTTDGFVFLEQPVAHR